MASPYHLIVSGKTIAPVGYLSRSDAGCFAFWRGLAMGPREARHWMDQGPRRSGPVSRKDRRRCLMVPVSPDVMAQLRVLSRGRSLGNAARVQVVRALDEGLVDQGLLPEPGWRVLAVQLPRLELEKITEIAQMWGRPREYVVSLALHFANRGRVPLE